MMKLAFVIGSRVNRHDALLREGERGGKRGRDGGREGGRISA